MAIRYLVDLHSKFLLIPFRRNFSRSQGINKIQLTKGTSFYVPIEASVLPEDEKGTASMSF